MCEPTAPELLHGINAAANGSPAYVYDLRTVRQRAAELRAAFPTAQLLYAVKANSNPFVVRQIIDAGFGIETVSLGEVLLARSLGAQRILFTNNNIDDREFDAVMAMAEAAEAGGAGEHIWVNCDSISRIRKVPTGRAIFIRVNGPVGDGHHKKVVTCGHESKFGVPHEMLPEAFAAASARGLRIVGLHQHIGSGVLDPASYIGAAGVLLGIVEAHAAELRELAHVDIGGGIGVAYKPGERTMDVAALGPALTARFAETQARVAAARGAAGVDAPAPLQLMLEPGRFLVAEAGTLLALVTTIKETPYDRTFAGINTGFHHLVRPAMYGSHHEIAVVADCEPTTRLTTGAAALDAAAAREPAAPPASAYIVAGNICESGDVFTPDGPRPLGSASQPLAEGQLLALQTAGAYGYAMASTYNTRPRPAEFIVDEAALLEAYLEGAAAGPSSRCAHLRRPGPLLRASGTGGAALAALCVTRSKPVAELVEEELRGGF
jgi:diaminopimelate decarboxylase